MLVNTKTVLDQATVNSYAVGAFNVYNLEGVKAVVLSAETENIPAIIQLHPESILRGGSPLVSACLKAASNASVRISVHLDHSDSMDAIQASISEGITSVMADGSSLDFINNIVFTSKCVDKLKDIDGFVEGELGKLSGTEDGVTEYESSLTDPEQANEFCEKTGIDALAVCIGNVHGSYQGEPKLDFNLLTEIDNSVSVPLVLHGASGLSDDLINRSIELGVRKLNVNTEVRQAYMFSLQESLKSEKPDVSSVMEAAMIAMSRVISSKIRLFAGIN